MANIAGIETRIEDVWLTDGAYPSFDLTKTLKEIDSVQKARKLDERNDTISFTQNQYNEMEDAERNASSDDVQRTVKRIAKHLSEKEFENPLEEAIDFEKNIEDKDTSDNEREFSALEDV